MVKKRVIRATEFLQQCLKETGVDVSKIILFGSQSREEATEESDIDILIISEDFRGKDVFERAKLTKDAEIITTLFNFFWSSRKMPKTDVCMTKTFQISTPTSEQPSPPSQTAPNLHKNSAATAENHCQRMTI